MNYLMKKENNHFSRQNKQNKKIFFGIFFLFPFFLLVYVLLRGFFSKNTSKNFTFVSPLATEVTTEVLKKEMNLRDIETRGMPFVYDDEIVATLSSGTTVYFKKKGSEDFSKILASLQLILENIRIEGRWPLKIDLRFTRPVLSF